MSKDETNENSNLFGAYVAMFQQDLKRMCHTEANYHTQDGEDLFQEVLIRLWKRASSFNIKKGKFLTWAGRIISNTWKDMLRKATKRAPRVELDTSTIEQMVSADRTDEQEAEALKRFRLAFQKLSKQYQELIYEMYFEEKAPHEIAKERGLTPRQIHNKLYQARLNLRKLMESEKLHPRILGEQEHD